MEKEYHSSLIKKGFALFLISILLGFSKCINVFLNGNAQLVFSDTTDVTRPVFSASSLPWFNLVITFLTIAYVVYSLYFASTLKDEVKLKLTTI